MKCEHDLRVALVGSGLIGSGWAIHLLCHGVNQIILQDISEQALERAKKLVLQGLDFMMENGAITGQQKQKYLDDLQYTTNLEQAVQEADFILENGPENLEVKQSILSKIEAVCREDAIITSSTSGIMIGEIAKNALHPERVIGAHPYHPVYLLPLVEIVTGPKTQDGYLDRALSFFRSVGKKPVVLKKDSPGYIGSRLMVTLFRESVSMVMNGVCTLEDLDTAFTYGPGMRYALMGPYLVYQLTGGERGFQGTMCGPMGQSSEAWLQSLCNWDHWPDEAKEFFKNGAPKEICQIMDQRVPGTGRTNDELVSFRDKGLLELLKYHQLI